MTQTPNDSALRECPRPFSIGDEKHELEVSLGYENLWRVRCTCGMAGPAKLGWTKAEAIAAWNTRPQPAEAPREAGLWSVLLACETDRQRLLGDGFNGDTISDRVQRVLGGYPDPAPASSETGLREELRKSLLAMQNMKVTFETVCDYAKEGEGEYQRKLGGGSPDGFHGYVDLVKAIERTKAALASPSDGRVGEDELVVSTYGPDGLESRMTADAGLEQLRMEAKLSKLERVAEAAKDFMEGRGGRTHIGSLTMAGMSCPDHCEACKLDRALAALSQPAKGE